MKYKITIERTQTVSREIGQKWECIGGNPESKYAYTPSLMADREDTETIYEQTVEMLDLARAIKAINDL